MPAKYIVTGQKVQPDKAVRAKELRKQMTDEEHILWQALRRSQLNGMHFHRQQVIDGFIVDFYCHQAGLVIEVDGDIHEEQKDYDAQRDLILAHRGLKIIRIKNEAIQKDLKTVLVQIEDLCKP